MLALDSNSNVTLGSVCVKIKSAMEMITAQTTLMKEIVSKTLWGSPRINFGPVMAEKYMSYKSCQLKKKKKKKKKHDAWIPKFSSPTKPEIIA